jgi:hypothetical protein
MGLPKLDTVAHEALLGVRRMWYMGLRLKFHLRKEKKSLWNAMSCLPTPLQHSRYMQLSTLIVFFLGIYFPVPSSSCSERVGYQAYRAPTAHVHINRRNEGSSK